jgi:hypothetical protein
VIAGLSGGTIQLPYGAVTVPVVSLLLSQLDSKFVNRSIEHNLPLPHELPPQ